MPDETDDPLASADDGDNRGRSGGGEETTTDGTGPRALADWTVPGTERFGDVTVERVLTWTLAVAVVLAVLAVVAIGTLPDPSADPYTEFYVLGPDGVAADYPTNLTAGDTASVVVGLTNHEHATETYRVEVRYGDETVDTLEATVDDGETWEQEVSFGAGSPGTKRLRLLLFPGDGGGEPYRETGLTVRVDDPDG